MVGRQQGERNSYQRIKGGRSVCILGLTRERTHPDREEPHDDRSCSGRQVWVIESETGRTEARRENVLGDRG